MAIATGKSEVEVPNYPVHVHQHNILPTLLSLEEGCVYVGKLFQMLAVPSVHAMVILMHCWI